MDLDKRLADTHKKLPGHDITVQEYIEANKTYSRKLLVCWLLSKVGFFGEEFAVPFCSQEDSVRCHWGGLFMQFLVYVFVHIEDGLEDDQKCLCYEVYKRTGKYCRDLEGMRSVGQNPFNDIVSVQEDVTNLFYGFAKSFEFMQVGLSQQFLHELILEVDNVSSAISN